MIKELDSVISTIDITPDIKSNTIGVVLSISKDAKSYLVEFFDEDNETIGNGMTVVANDQVKLFKKEG